MCHVPELSGSNPIGENPSEDCQGSSYGNTGSQNNLLGSTFSKKLFKEKLDKCFTPMTLDVPQLFFRFSILNGGLWGSNSNLKGGVPSSFLLCQF